MTLKELQDLIASKISDGTVSIPTLCCANIVPWENYIGLPFMGLLRLDDGVWKIPNNYVKSGETYRKATPNDPQVVQVVKSYKDQYLAYKAEVEAKLPKMEARYKKACEFAGMVAGDIS